MGGKPSLLINRQTFILDKNGKIIGQFEVKDPGEHLGKAFETLDVPF